MPQSTLIAELLCTRLCHDITGPIGAVNNGAEFLEEEDFSMNEDALKLITDSAKEAVHRLMFFRQAYGRVKEPGDACLEDRKSLVEGYLRQTRVKLDWPDTHTDAAEMSLSQGTAKLLLNFIVLVSAALIKGGVLKVRLEKMEESGRLSVTGEGPMVKMDKDLVQALTENIPVHDVAPKTVQAYFTRELALTLNAPIHLTLEGEKIEIRIDKQQF